MLYETDMPEPIVGTPLRQGFRPNTEGLLSHRVVYALLGALLGLGAPLGAITLKLTLVDDLNFRNLHLEFAREAFFYLYMFFATVPAFSLFGYFLGKQTDRIAIQEKIFYELSIRDPLTGTYNRRHFEVRLEAEFGRAKRYQSALTCLMLDIDHFKSVNDRFGHDFGDTVLKKVTSMIWHRIREYDILARYGGEEFVVLLPQTEIQPGFQLAEEIRQAVANGEFVTPKRKRPLTLAREQPETIGLTISIGVSNYPASEISDRYDFVKKADAAMYQAKVDGRNRTNVYNPG